MSGASVPVCDRVCVVLSDACVVHREASPWADSLYSWLIELTSKCVLNIFSQIQLTLPFPRLAPDNLTAIYSNINRPDVGTRAFRGFCSFENQLEIYSFEIMTFIAL